MGAIMWDRGQGPKIFIVEDDSMVLDLIATRLELGGYRVAFARNGLQAVNDLADYRPAGMLLDINMPIMDGFEVLRSIRLRSALAHLPVLMLTARNAAEDVRRAVQLGAKDYLTKPFTDNQLMTRVARLIRKRPEAMA